MHARAVRGGAVTPAARAAVNKLGAHKLGAHKPGAHKPGRPRLTGSSARRNRDGMIIWLRSLAFNLFFYGWTALLCVGGLPLLLAPGHWTRRAQTVWARGVLVGARWLVGIRYQIRGRANLPDAGPVILAARHESAWDTIVFLAEIPGSVYVIKAELLKLPLYGAFCRKSGMIAIDRDAGMRALKSLLAAARDRLAAGRSIIIFPQGTRVAPGQALPYQPGIAALYGQVAAPVLPVALNSGRCWGRRAFLKAPGLITVDILPPLPTGLKRADMMAMLEARIESAYHSLP